MFNFGKRRTRKIVEFIPSEGVEVQFFEKNYQRYLGRDVRWEKMVNALNGREGFVVTSSESIRPDAVRRMRADARESRRRDKFTADRLYFEQLHKDWRQQRDQISLETPAYDGCSAPTFRISSEHNTDANMSQAFPPSPDYSQPPIHGEYSTPESPTAPPPAYDEACNSPFGDETVVFPTTPGNYDYFYPVDEANRLSPHWHPHFHTLSGSDDLGLGVSRSARDLGSTRPVSQGFLDATGCFLVPR